LLVERANALEVAAELAVARPSVRDLALIARQKLRIASWSASLRTRRSARSAWPTMALTFEELEASATEDELAAEKAVAKSTTCADLRAAPTAIRSDHLPRERVVIAPPTACACAAATAAQARRGRDADAGVAARQ